VTVITHGLHRGQLRQLGGGDGGEQLARYGQLHPTATSDRGTTEFPRGFTGLANHKPTWRDTGQMLTLGPRHSLNSKKFRTALLFKVVRMPNLLPLWTKVGHMLDLAIIF
jgi:hypothetical protein